MQNFFLFIPAINISLGHVCEWQQKLGFIWPVPSRLDFCWRQASRQAKYVHVLFSGLRLYQYIEDDFSIFFNKL